MTRMDSTELTKILAVYGPLYKSLSKPHNHKISIVVLKSTVTLYVYHYTVKIQLSFVKLYHTF